MRHLGPPLLAAWLLCLSTPALAGSAERNAAKAEQAFAEGDYPRAMKKCSKALKKDGSNMDAAGVCGAVLYFSGKSIDNQEVMDAGASLLETVAMAYPASPYVLMWRGTTTDRLIVAREFGCEGQAQDDWDRAEQAFGVGDMAAAQSFYKSAAARCEDPALWTFFGDSYFHQGQYPDAIAAYDHALEIDPYYWPARRFKGDAFVQQGQTEEGLRWTASAIAANPGYTFAWRYLESALDPRLPAAQGHRLPADAPVLPGMEEIADSTKVVVLVFAAGRAPWPTEVSTHYQMALQMARHDGDTAPILEALRSSIQYVKESGQLQDQGMELWALLAEAESSDLLQEAVYILLLDEHMVEQFIEYRETHMESLTDYVMQLMSR